MVFLGVDVGNDWEEQGFISGILMTGRRHVETGKMLEMYYFLIQMVIIQVFTLNIEQFMTCVLFCVLYFW